MSGILLILPDFLIILLGAFLRAKVFKDEPFWSSMEKLVFYVLLPAQLFCSVTRANVPLGEAGIFLTAGVAAMMVVMGLAWAVRWIVKSDRVTHASVFHCGFRFNTYIGFALADRIGGAEATAFLALLIAVWVPISNAAATAELARAVAMKTSGTKGLAKKTLEVVVTNPLILATAGGLLWKALKLPIPTTAGLFLEHLGDAALATGLICIGAGLTIRALKEAKVLISASTIERLVAAPIAAILVTHFFPLTPMAHAVVILFAALPTAQSCYVMTAAMGGNAPVVAGVTTAHVLGAAVTLPLWTIVLQQILAGTFGF